MPDLVPVRRALISVSDKTGLIPLAEALAALEVEIVSTGGTAAALADAGIAVIKVEEVTGRPEMMGGRVKTLHPAIHGAVLARRDVETDCRALADQGITPIDLVCVNLYPFEETIRGEGVTSAEALEQIDIGGPTLLRSAAKNHPFVTVVTAPDQYRSLLDELEAQRGATTPAFRRRLAAEAFRRTAEYDACITSWLDARTGTSALNLSYTDGRELRYGENPHQAAALYVEPAPGRPGVASARMLHGKALSYNNILDAAAALELIRDLHAVTSGRPCAAIIKHTNPCGAATADSPAAAFDLAYEADALAAYGGILAVNHELDEATTEHICQGQKFLEVIVAPGYDDTALEKLGGRWKNVRLLAVGDLQPPSPDEMSYRSIPGGMLAQQRDTVTADPRKWQHAAGPPPDDAMLADAAFAWTVVKHLKSNAVVLTTNGHLLGGGCDQVDRVSACRLAIEKAKGHLHSGGPIVAASDAFFPFPDGPELLIDAGAKCIVHPGGSKRDQETLDLCNQFRVTCLLTGVRHFRH
ncbi:MAG: bifunctional phosphoribosylaminoimidazolecarboxamide formyltransferase/IMP cyclohydrolase [Planctomycetota bacterium]|jgi:phosphoribosylaminoimidazolecarboxamide formyltransferase/IMP cyclohydrolase